MKNYWDDGELYSQPSESLLKRNASDSLKKQKMKGKTMHPIIISSRKIARSWWGMRGVKIWKDMRITPPDWNVGNGMYVPEW